MYFILWLERTNERHINKEPKPSQIVTIMFNYGMAQKLLNLISFHYGELHF